MLCHSISFSPQLLFVLGKSCGCIFFREKRQCASSGMRFLWIFLWVGYALMFPIFSCLKARQVAKRSEVCQAACKGTAESLRSDALAGDANSQEDAMSLTASREWASMGSSSSAARIREADLLDDMPRHLASAWGSNIREVCIFSSFTKLF